jgi:hypothetical protein
MAIAATTGAQIFIGPTTAAVDVAAYKALTYKEIKTVESIGEFGDQATTIEFTALGDARVRKRKGVRNAGDLQCVCGADNLDTGQLAAIAAQATDFAYAFKILTADGADANDTDSAYFFHALVASARINIGGANQIIRRSFACLIDTQVFEEPTTVVP